MAKNASHVSDFLGMTSFDPLSLLLVHRFTNVVLFKRKARSVLDFTEINLSS